MTSSDFHKTTLCTTGDQVYESTNVNSVSRIEKRRDDNPKRSELTIVTEKSAITLTEKKTTIHKEEYIEDASIELLLQIDYLQQKKVEKIKT